MSKATRMGRVGLAVVLGVGLLLVLVGSLGRWEPALAQAEAGTEAALVEPSPAIYTGTTVVQDPRVAAVLAQVTPGTLTLWERRLTGEETVLVGGHAYTFTTRNSFSSEPISRATRYVYEQFEDMGLDVAFHNYIYHYNNRSYNWRNVVAERRGIRRPEEVYLITAHLDDMPATGRAPGADDNASGSSAVLMAADLLRDLDFDCTLRFVLFTGEEQGMRGSAAYASALAAQGENVQGVLNLDMIAYNSDAAPVVDLHVNSAVAGSLEIAETFSHVVAAYDLDLVPDILMDNALGEHSDNKSFWDQGYAAILAIEDYDDFNPYYHTLNDTLDNLDVDYFTEFVRAGVGTLAHMGCMASAGTLSGTVTDWTGQPVSATITAVAGLTPYTATVPAAGDYAMRLPPDTFTVRAEPYLSMYYPAIFTNVVIITDTTTVLNVTLSQWPHQVFVPVLMGE